MKFDFLHCALLAIVVLIAVYGFGSGVFREGWTSVADACDECATNCVWGSSPLSACLKSCWSTLPATSSPAQTKCRKACISSRAATEICKGNGHR